MSGQIYDVIVIGAGIVGSATAYHLAKDNKRTLLLEQFPLPHTRGSSHGQTRIIRRAYVQPHYAEMMGEAYYMWHQLERETSTKLFYKTGLLTISGPGSDYADKTETALTAVGSIYQRLTGDQINKQFPMLKFDAENTAVYEADAGVLMADKCLHCLQKMFQSFGGHLKDGEGVKEITHGDIITIHTSKSHTYQARSIVITAGPWTNKVLAPLGLTLPLEAKKANVCYWKQKSDIGYGLNDNYPCVVVDGSVVDQSMLHVYSTPCLEYPLHVKICGNSHQDIDPDNRDLEEDNTEENKLRSFVKKHYPGLECEPSIKECGITTKTPERDFVIDKHPLYKNVVIGAGFSGHGFKMAPVVGKILSCMASNVAVHQDISPFNIARFNVHVKSKM